MAKHRKEFLSKECGIMENGFDSDPQFEIISMPDPEEKETEQDKDDSEGSDLLERDDSLRAGVHH